MCLLCVRLIQSPSIFPKVFLGEKLTFWELICIGSVGNKDNGEFWKRICILIKSIVWIFKKYFENKTNKLVLALVVEKSQECCS